MPKRKLRVTRKEFPDFDTVMSYVFALHEQLDIMEDSRITLALGGQATTDSEVFDNAEFTIDDILHTIETNYSEFARKRIMEITNNGR